MFEVVVCLTSFKRMDEWSNPVVVGSFPTKEKAASTMDWVERDLQKKGFYVDDVRCHANDQKGFENARSVFGRFPYPAKSYDGTELRYIGCIFYMEKPDAPQA